jgi:hypothetical protein
LLQFYAVGDWFNQRLQFKHCSLANFREFDLSRLFQIHFLQNGTTYLIDTFYFNLCTLTFFCVNLLVIGRRWTSNLDFRQEVSKFCLRIVSHWNWTQILEWFVFKWSLWTTWVQLFGYIGYFFIYAFEDEFWWCDKWDIYTTFKLMTWTWVPKWESIYILHFEKKELTFWKLGTKTVNLEIKVKSSTLNK